MSNGQGGIFGGVRKMFGQQQMSPDQMRQMLMGEQGTGGVGDILNQQQGLYGSMMEGKIPDSMRMNIMGAGQDLAAGDAYNTSRLLSAGGMAPGSGLGAALGQVSSSQRGNEAINQLGKLNLDTMKMGGEGMRNVLQARQGTNASTTALARANMADTNLGNQQIGGLLGGGMANLLGGRKGGELDEDGNPIQTRGGFMGNLMHQGVGLGLGMVPGVGNKLQDFWNMFGRGK